MTRRFYDVNFLELTNAMNFNRGAQASIPSLLNYGVMIDSSAKVSMSFLFASVYRLYCSHGIND